MQENKDLIQQINFIGRLTEAANVFIIIEKKRKYYIRIFTKFCKCNILIIKTKVLFKKLIIINNGKSKDNQFNRQN